MAGIPSRHRSLFLLAGVIILQVLLLAVQIKRDSQGRLIRVWTVGAVSPFEKGGAYTVGHIRRLAALLCAPRYRQGERAAEARERPAQAANHAIARARRGSRPARDAAEFSAGAQGRAHANR